MFARLHEEAANKVKSDGKFLIFNSAIQGKQKNTSFTGMGQHLILITFQKEDAPHTKEEAAQALKTYLHAFTGYNWDDKDKLNFSMLKPIYSNNKETSEVINESIGCKFFIEKMLVNDTQSSLCKLVFETARDDDELATHDDSQICGYYFRYDISTPSQGKKNILSKSVSILSQLVSNAVDSLQFQTYNWQSGPSGQWNKLKDISKILSREIDPNKLCSAIQQIIANDFQKQHVDVYIENSKALAGYLRNRLDDKNLRHLISEKFSLCINVHKREKIYPMINKKYISKVLERALSNSFVNVLNQSFAESEIILVNNYSDNLRDKYEKNYSKTLTDITNTNVDDFTGDWKAAIVPIAKLLKFMYIMYRYDLFYGIVTSAPTSTSGSPGDPGFKIGLDYLQGLTILKKYPAFNIDSRYMGRDPYRSSNAIRNLLQFNSSTKSYSLHTSLNNFDSIFNLATSSEAGDPIKKPIPVLNKEIIQLYSFDHTSLARIFDGLFFNETESLKPMYQSLSKMGSGGIGNIFSNIYKPVFIWPKNAFNGVKFGNCPFTVFTRIADLKTKILQHINNLKNISQYTDDAIMKKHGIEQQMAQQTNADLYVIPISGIKNSTDSNDIFVDNK